MRLERRELDEISSLRLLISKLKWRLCLQTSRIYNDRGLEVKPPF